ncbi:MAG: ATPase, T2SS/T4P/T4SS family [Clostridium sp.]
MDNKSTFKIGSLLKSTPPNNDVAPQELDENSKYLEAERLVLDRIINHKGNDVEAREYNEILAKCILGDLPSIAQLKEFIRKYLTESNKYDKNQISLYIEKIYTNNFGLAAIDDLVKDKSINEIWVNGYSHIWIEKGGLKTRLDRQFKDDAEIIRVMRQMLQYDRKEINVAKPTAESKLLDGSRITFAIPPASSMPVINIRKFEAFEVTEENVLGSGTISPKQLEFLKCVIKGRTNILVIGETGSGKTSFLKFLCDYINPNLRIGTVESNLELKLTKKYPDRNIFEYESHEELGIDLGTLFRLCLRSSPDIVILGEARGSEETQALINSMRRGHPGSIGTIHTNSADTAIDDLVEMVSEDGRNRDMSLLKHRIVNAVEMIVQAHRFESGERRIVRITEIVPIKDDETFGKYKLNDLWEFDSNKKEFIQVGTVIGKNLLDKYKFFGLTDEDFEVIGIKK